MSNDTHSNKNSSLMFLLGLNWTTILGSNLAFIAAVADLVVFILIGIGAIHHAYVGVVAFLLLPGLFILGSILIVLGVWRHHWKKRKQAASSKSIERFPVIDFNHPLTRNVAWLLFLLTIGNMIVLSVLTFEGVTYTSSNSFCGAVCHTPMEPQYVAFLDSPHAGIDCVDCHVGTGAAGFATAKLSGVGQMYEALIESFPRPITSPRTSVAPVNDACVKCHSHKADRAQLLDVAIRYLDDEQNSLDQSALVFEMGTVDTDSGIHGWHNQPGRIIQYAPSAEDPDTIQVVRVTEPEGDVVEYWTDGNKHTALDNWLTMTCIDCHNRVGHRFISPDEAIDTALWTKAIDPSIPHIKSTAINILEALNQGEEKHTVAEKTVEHYRETLPEVLEKNKKSIQQSAKVIQSIANRNVFPEMKVTWETYPDFSGHTSSIGCMRCHDDNHIATNGRTIRMDCMLCHNVIDWK